eukprot:gene8993-10615_t
MSPPKASNDDAIYHFAASGIAAVINFPLWRASAIAQSGFKLEGSNMLVRYYNAVIQPPFRGLAATLFGMTWARAAIFFGADIGKDYCKALGMPSAAAATVPTFLIGSFVQIANMPLVRATITIQDPKSTSNNVRQALASIYKSHGVAGLYHGVSAAIMKTVPKYITAVAVKDYMEDTLPRADPLDRNAVLVRSAIKSVTAGVAGAVLTNPLDVLRNEMFKTELGLVDSYKKLMREEGAMFMARGIAANTTAVAAPL